MAEPKARFDAVVDAPFGRVGVILRGAAIADVSFLSPALPLKVPATPLARRVCQRLQAYFRNAHTRFDVRLELDGTAFQQRVWRMLRRIPVGQVVSYGELARRLNSSPRAVGNACRRNPIPIYRAVSSGSGGERGRRLHGETKRAPARHQTLVARP